MNHDVFISYTTVEKKDAEQVKDVLETNGFKCWMAPESIPGGSSYANEIENAIKTCEVVVVILSDKAQDSIWIPKEVSRAFSYKKIIIPFHIDESDVRDPFRFLLSDAQRIEAYNNVTKAYEQLIASLTRVVGKPKSLNNKSDSFGESKTVNNTASEKETKETKISKTTEYDECKIYVTLDDGLISFSSEKVKSFDDKYYLDFSGEIKDKITTQLKSIMSYLYQISIDDVKIDYYDNSDTVKLVPDSAEQWHAWSVEKDYQIAFRVRHLESEKELEYEDFHFDLDEDLELSFFKKGNYLHKPDGEIIPFEELGIDTEATIDSATELIKLCHPGKRVKVQSKFKAHFLDDHSGGYHLSFIVL